MSDERNATFLAKLAGTNVMALYTGANKSCISLVYYTILKDPPPLENIQALSEHSAMGHC